MYGKTHTAFFFRALHFFFFLKKKAKKIARVLISKSGELNPMFGKEHSLLTRQSISDKMSKHP